MPQLIPFYFVNQLSFSFLSLLALIYIISKLVGGRISLSLDKGKINSEDNAFKGF